MNLTHSTDCTGMSIRDNQPCTSSSDVKNAFGKVFATMSMLLIMLMASNFSYAQTSEETAAAKAEQIKFDEKVRSTLKENAPVSYTHLRAHETVLDLVCRLLLEKQNTCSYNRHDYISTR